VAAINLDAIADDGGGETGRAVALGTIGKLLPSALVVGLPAHAGYSFNGLSACALAGALASEVEWAPELTEQSGDQIGAGPTLLGMKDAKTAYDVTTPDKVWMFWNVMLYARRPSEVMAQMERLARRAADGLAARLASRQASVGRSDAAPLPAVGVTTFQALRREVEERVPEARGSIAAFAQAVSATHADLPEQCRQIAEHVWRLSGRGDPTIILGFASTPYLATQLGEDANARRLAAAVAVAAQRISERHDTTVATPNYFLGISDMSFLGQADERDVPTIAGNTPAWGAGLHWTEGRAFAGLPIVNAGPWGRDYHTVLERLHTPYAFGVLPDLIGEIVTEVLAPMG
jgi:arginine utilization protein RocB